MRWPFRQFLLHRQSVAEPPAEHGVFVLGQLVQHKITKARAVVVGFFRSSDGDDCATLTVDWTTKGEFTAYLAEIEPMESAQSVGAVDPSATDTGNTSTRD